MNDQVVNIKERDRVMVSFPQNATNRQGEPLLVQALPDSGKIILVPPWAEDEKDPSAVLSRPTLRVFLNNLEGWSIDPETPAIHDASLKELPHQLSEFRNLGGNFRQLAENLVKTEGNVLGDEGLKAIWIEKLTKRFEELAGSTEEKDREPDVFRLLYEIGVTTGIDEGYYTLLVTEVQHRDKDSNSRLQTAFAKALEEHPLPDFLPGMPKMEEAKLLSFQKGIKHGRAIANTALAHAISPRFRGDDLRTRFRDEIPKFHKSSA